MPKKRVMQYKEVDLVAGDFQLEALLGESYLIRDILCAGSGAAQSCIVNIGGENMLNIPCIDDVLNVSPFYNTDINNVGMFQLIRSMYDDIPMLKVAEGEIMTLKANNALGTLTVGILWEERIDTELLDFGMPGGSKSDDRLFISWGENTFLVGATSVENHEIITPLQPAGFEDFPFGKIVPVNKNMQYIASIVTFGSTVPADEFVDGIQVWKNDESILSFEEEYAPITLFRTPADDKGIQIKLFPEKILFEANEDLRTYLRFNNTGVAPANITGTVAHIFHRVGV